jgi:3-hydroxyisobutyryl-CoA hydrolase
MRAQLIRQGPKRASEDFITGVRAVLVDRQMDRPEWQPSSITDGKLSPAEIVRSFFDPKSESQADRPQLDFNPRPTSKISSGADSTWGRFRQYGLPSEAEVHAHVTGSAPGAGAFKIKREELIERLLDSRGGPGGPKSHEIKSWSEALVDRMCEPKQGGYLDLKGSGMKQ